MVKYKLLAEPEKMTRIQWLTCWDRLRESLNTRISWDRNQIIDEMDRIEREMVRESERKTEEIDKIIDKALEPFRSEIKK